MSDDRIMIPFDLPPSLRNRMIDSPDEGGMYRFHAIDAESFIAFAKTHPDAFGVATPPKRKRMAAATEVNQPSSDEMSLTLAAQRLHVIYQTARNLMLRGDLHGRQIGGRWYVSKADVLRVELERGRARS